MQPAETVISGPGGNELSVQGVLKTVISVNGKYENTRQPYSINVQGYAIPYAITMPRSITIPLRNAVKQELMQAKGVIESVNEPTEWCAPLVIVPKPSGGIRLCVDLTKLNEKL